MHHAGGYNSSLVTSDSTPETGIRAPADLNPRADPCLDFPEADYGTLTPGDYDVLGFMSGLEVHQQLLTRSKLFCRCPAGRYTSRNDAVVLRHMRPTLTDCRNTYRLMTCRDVD